MGKTGEGSDGQAHKPRRGAHVVVVPPPSSGKIVANNVWIVGDFGTILKWNGTSWAAQPSAAMYRLNKVWGIDADHVWAVGATVGPNLLQWNGTAWFRQDTGTFDVLHGI